MNKHTYFDLLLHSDDELAQFLGTDVRERVTLHEWPLSCVQRVTLADGRHFIYKTESGPTVEAEFYARAKSPLLVKAQTVLRDHHNACLILEDIPAPRIEEIALSEEKALQTGLELLEQIAQIEPVGTLPVYLDVSSWDRWRAVMEGMLQDLHGLVVTGKYQAVQRDALSLLANWVSSPQLKAVFDTSIALVHHDLSAENVFRLQDGYRVIDWQRPILGPAGIDLVLFLVSLGYDPRPYVTPGIVWMTDLLAIQWLTECTLAWFPPGAKTYDQMIANRVRQFA